MEECSLDLNVFTYGQAICFSSGERGYFPNSLKLEKMFRQSESI